MLSQSFACYGHIQGTVLIIGYGSIGSGITPMIKRHFTYDKFVIIDPVEQGPQDPTIHFEKIGLTEDNYIEVLDRIFRDKKGFCVNLSVQTSSKDILIYCQSKGIFYIDTVVEQWEGFYSNTEIPISDRTNYALRENLKKAVQEAGHTTTAVSCCGANPGMVSWLVKQALINIARDTNFQLQKEPVTQLEWAKLMKDLGIHGIHIAERDTQRTNERKPPKEFWNTWSVDGFISEAFHQASELGWGTHEKSLPSNAFTFQSGPKCAIYLNQPGAATKVKSWCPTYGAQFGYLVTHNQSISISDYFTVKQEGNPVYRPTCMYAYHPTDDAVSSIDEAFGSGNIQEKWKIIKPHEIVDGFDELGVLLYGHAKNAYWYGNKLSIQDTVKKVEGQNATALQVTTAVIAGMIWAMKNPNEGVVETEEMDYKTCLALQQTYIGDFKGYYTDWTPLKNKSADWSQNSMDESNPWDFKNLLMNNK